MKKILSWLLVLCMICSLLPASVFTASAAATSGECGRDSSDSVQWSFDSETGTLTISGKGYMFNYDSCASYFDPYYEGDPSIRPWEDFLDKIITVNIKSGVLSVGCRAFDGCDQLTQVILPAGMTNVGEESFNDCCSLTYIGIPEGVESIGIYAFSGCENLTTAVFSTGLTSISDNLFSECYNLTEVTIPATVEEIADTAFADCDKLSAIYFDGTSEQWNSIEKYGVTYDNIYFNSYFGTCGNSQNNLVWFYEPTSDVLTLDGIGRSSSRPWIKNENIRHNVKKLCIRDGIKGFNEADFSNMDGLTEIEFPTNPFSLGKESFCDCDNLITVTIPGNVTGMGTGCFAGCYGLTTVIIEEGRTSLSCTFENCNALATIYIPVSVTTITDNTFYGCTALSNVHYAGTEEQWNAITVGSGNEALTNATVHFANVTSGSCGAEGDNLTWTFDSATGALTISGSGAMANFDGIAAPWNGCNVKSVSISEGVTTIGKKAFYELPNLTDVVFPARLKSIGADAFNSNQNITNAQYNGFYSYWGYDLVCESPLNFYVITSDSYYVGFCGTGKRGLSWELSPSGEFYLCGGGYTDTQMVDYTLDNLPPWFPIRDKIKSLSYPDHIGDGFGDYAFYDCYNLTSIYSEADSTIGEGTFMNCSSLKTVEDLYSIKTVGAKAFKNCTSLTKVNLRYRIQTIGVEAFAGCEALKEITLGESLQSVGDSAFSGCENLMLVYYLGERTEYSMKISDVVTVGDGNEDLVDYALLVIDDIASGSCGSTASYDFNVKTGVMCVGGDGYVGSDQWRRARALIKTIEINGGEFQDGVFSDCDNLTDIVCIYGYSLKSKVFYDCDGLIELTIPRETDSMGKYIFAECDSLQTVAFEDGTTKIGVLMFSGCDALTTAYIPASVTLIGEGSFDNCNAFSDVYYAGSESQWNEITFQNDNEVIKNATIHFGVVEQDPYSGTCGAEGDNLTWTFDPDTGILTISGDGAMADYVAGGAPWAEYSEVVRNIVFEGNLTYIGDYAFACYDMRAVVVPASVTGIGDGAFSECSGLGRITLPAGITYMGDGIFTGLDNDYFTVSFTGTEAQWADFDKGNGNEILDEAEHIFLAGAGIVSGTYNDSITWRLDLETGILLILGEGEMSSDKSSWGGPWIEWEEYIRVAYIEEGITSLVSGAFEDYWYLNTIYFPSSITEFGSDATFGCNMLTNVYYDGSAEQWESLDKSRNWRLERYAEIHCDTPYGTCCVEDIVIWRLNPESSELTVTGRGEMVGEDWYEFEDQIKTVNISSGVTKVGGFGKYQYPNISKVVLPDTVTEIKDFAFDRCIALKEINLPEGLISIGECAFQSCDSLTEIILPNSLQYLGKDAFYCCDGLISVVIPGSVTEFGGSGQFYGCTALENVTIQKGITSINLSMFTDCTSLSTVYLPVSLKVISSDAFMGCSSLSDVYYAGSIAQWNQITVGMNNEALKNATIHFGGACTHESTTDTVVDATCLTAGSVTTICDDCGETVKVTATPIGDHSYDGVVTEPTCTEDGYTTFTCSVCGDSYVGDVVPRPGHIYTPDKTVDPTCEVPGRTIYHCTVCGDVITILIPNPGHTFESVVTEPTCTEAGYTTNTCSVCGHIEITDEVPALGHSYDKVVTAPTCTEEGYTTCTCSVCSFVEIVDKVPATGHVYDEIITEPTCTEDGYTTYLCSVCGDTYTDNVVTHPGHSYESVVTAPTCTEEGYTTNTCTVCGEISIVDVVPATGHVDTTTVTEDATCLDDGLITVTCNTCGEVVSEEVIPALGHDYETVVTAPTCTEDGYTTYTCSVCGDTYTADVTPAKGHRYNIEVTVAPGCEQPGEHTYTCTVCGDKFAVVVAPTGHALSYTNNGDNHTIVCDNNCGYSVEEAHSFVDGACICGALEVAPPTQVNIKIGHALALDSDLGVKYRVKYSDIGADVPNYVTAGAYLVIEKDVYPSGAEKTVETYVLAADLTSDPARMVFDMKGIQAAEMGSELRAVLHVFDAEGREYISNVDVYSIVDYVEQYLSNFSYESNPKFVTMLIDMLNYGAAAQVNFGRRTDELVNAGLEAYQQYATKELAAELTDVKETISNDRSITAVSKMGFSINLADKTEINAKMTLAAGYTMEDISKVEVRNAAGNVVDTITEFKLLVDDNNRVQVTFSGVKSVNMRDMFYFVVYVGDQIASDTYGYSIEASAKTTIANSTGSSADMILACMYYGDSAAAYFGK